MRITPAGAGKTTECPAGSYACNGSPPQVRGKLFLSLASLRSKRITPAGAGKTVQVEMDIAGTTDHPRRCGENAGQCLCFLSVSGSPPQVRGKHFLDFSNTIRNRITPAGAGKTSQWSKRLCIPPDHPRRCGENQPYQRRSGYDTGSPPQVRGKPRRLSLCSP